MPARLREFSGEVGSNIARFNRLGIVNIRAPTLESLLEKAYSDGSAKKLIGGSCLKSVNSDHALRQRMEAVSVTLGALQGRRVLSIQEDVSRGSASVLEEATGFCPFLVCSVPKSSKSTSDNEQARFSKSFGQNFWDEIGAELEFDLVISDGQLGHYHQLQMLRTLFPALIPGGTLVLERRSIGEGSAADSNALLKFLIAVSTDRTKHRTQVASNTAIHDYFLRNVESISFRKNHIFVEKRQFVQRRFEAVSLAQVASYYRVVDKPEIYDRIEPQLFGSGTIRQKSLEIIEKAGNIPAPVAAVGRLERAVISGGGIIHTEDGFIIEESMINTRHTSRRGPFFRIGTSAHFVSEDSLVPEEALSDGAHALLKQTWDKNYGHWIVDTLPRVETIAQLGGLSDLKFIVNGSAPEHIRRLHSDSLELFGIGKDQLIAVDRRPLEISNLVYATPSTIPPMVKSTETIRTLEKLAEKVSDLPSEVSIGHSKIYVSRNAYPRRRLRNEQAILELLEVDGYEVIQPEKYSFVDQVKIFSGATHIVGNMGAAFANLAFSPSGVSVLMLATENMLHDYFYDLVCHKQGRYFAVQGTSDDSGRGIGSDFSIDIGIFSEVYDAFRNDFP